MHAIASLDFNYYIAGWLTNPHPGGSHSVTKWLPKFGKMEVGSNGKNKQAI
jgi:hypothetical protein